MPSQGSRCGACSAPSATFAMSTTARSASAFRATDCTGQLLDAEGVRDMDNWLADQNLRRRSLTELSRQIARRASTVPCI